MAVRDGADHDDQPLVKLVNTDRALAHEVISALQACVRVDYLDADAGDSAASLLSYGGYSRVDLESGNIEFLENRLLVCAVGSRGKVSLHWLEADGYRLFLDNKPQPELSREEAIEALAIGVADLEKDDKYPIIIYSDMETPGHIVCKPGTAVEEAKEILDI